MREQETYGQTRGRENKNMWTSVHLFMTDEERKMSVAEVGIPASRSCKYEQQHIGECDENKNLYEAM